MGRGLSPLQRWMLRKALDNRIKEGRTAEIGHGADLYYFEIKQGYFGLGSKCSEGARESPGNHRFNASEPGYRAASASINRAARRLNARGLVECVFALTTRWSGIVLTSTGVHQAQNLRDSSGVGREK